MKTLDTILTELSPLIGEDLYPDKHQACVLVMNEKIRIQIEMDLTGEFLFLVAMIADVPPGKFRENVLMAALKANDTLSESLSVLSFVAKVNKLILFEQVPTSEITATRLHGHLLEFFHKAEKWKNAIDRGNSSPV